MKNSQSKNIWLQEWLMGKTKLFGYIFGFIIVPLLLYLFITQWDPTKDREEISLGMTLILILYWFALYLISKYKKESAERRRQIKRLLDGIMNEKETLWLKDELRKQPHFIDENDAERWGY